ncbi:MAG: DUF1549 domain-containing protein, partial [Planctomycetes bacterium]|nr:DUF1549 domain-containing protein [Planctomycetota bacterium]
LRLDVREAALAGAIVPGAPAASPMVARVMTEDPDVRMPPPGSHKPALSTTEIETLKRWIAAGAEYEPHWSYVAPQRPAAPVVQRAAWPRNPIDAFVLAAQEAAGCGPSPEADRTTLVRRAYLDLTGLPPTPDEAEQFLLDNRPDAYERLVDRLTASSHYAERMASWWFDLVRFADTVGYHGDQDQAIL